MNICIVGVGKSTNIGDQLIAKSLGAVVESLGYSKVSYYDLHEGLYDVEFCHEQLSCENFKENKEVGFKFYSPRFTKLYLKNYFNKRNLNEIFSVFDVVIIGGGHLLIDNYGDFVIKISDIVNVCNRLNIKSFFWSVGVGKHHSLAWRFLAKRHFKNIPIYTRDKNSCERAKKLHLNVKGYVLDAALPISHHYKLDHLVDENSITLFIMDPFEMARHSSYRVSRQDASDWWLALIKLLSNKFDKIYIANNGSLSDFYFIKKYINEKLHSSNDMRNKVHIKERAKSYAELLCAVGESNFVVAQRLHAIIPSISYGVKFIGLKWDDKVSSIISDLNLDRVLVDYDFSPELVVEKILNEIKLDDNSKTKLEINNYNATLLKAIND